MTESREFTTIVPLDITAAFDAFNHGILITCLEHCVVIKGTALEWFSFFPNLIFIPVCFPLDPF